MRMNFVDRFLQSFASLAGLGPQKQNLPEEPRIVVDRRHHLKPEGYAYVDNVTFIETKERRVGEVPQRWKRMDYLLMGAGLDKKGESIPSIKCRMETEFSSLPAREYTQALFIERKALISAGYEIVPESD